MATTLHLAQTDGNSNITANISAVGTHTFEVSSASAPLKIIQKKYHGAANTNNSGGALLEVIGGYFNSPITVFEITSANSIEHGRHTTASGDISHAEGISTTASGQASHAEGSNTTASGYVSHAEGSTTTASGIGSHSQGTVTNASGYFSCVGGYYAHAAHDLTWLWKGSTVGNTLSTTRSHQFMVSAQGGSAFFGNVGIGTDNKNNALTVVGNISASEEIITKSLSADTLKTITIENCKRSSQKLKFDNNFGKVITFENSNWTSDEGIQYCENSLIFQALSSETLATFPMGEIRAYRTPLGTNSDFYDSFGLFIGGDPIAARTGGQFQFANNQIIVDSNGVGIGTTTPNEALTVVGNISATGTLQLSLTSTPPSNTTTPAAWEDIQVGEVTYKIPLYL